MLTPTQLQNDVKLMAHFVAAVMGRDVPSLLRMPLPVKDVYLESGNMRYFRKMRVQVCSWDDKLIVAINEDGEKIKIDYHNGGYDGDLCYISALLSKGMQLNLLDTHVEEDGVYVPKTIIVWPDYLVDVSALAACFKEYGHDERNYVLARLESHEDTSYTLLGQVAGQFLDDMVNAVPGDVPVTYAASVRKVFHMQPLAFSYVRMNEKFSFHEEAKRQFNHIRCMVEQEVRRGHGFNEEQGLIEPSFLCEALGLQGRMDYLQADYTRVIEQKSGKMDEFRHTHREPHYVQMMLYQAILAYNVDQPLMRTEANLLYSRYADGLYREQPYQQLLREALVLRNRIVVQEVACAEGAAEKVLQDLQADDLLTEKVSKLWTQWQRPALERLLKPFQTGGNEKDTMALKYFFRFYTFLVRELLQGKMGIPGNAGKAFSDLWLLPPVVRREVGDLYWKLRVTRLKEKDDGVTSVCLQMENNGDMFLSSFRRGDAVLLYCYKTSEPDVRLQFLMRGRLSEVRTVEVEVELTHPQRNRHVFDGADALFAVEHDMQEAAYGRMFAGLYQFLVGNEYRRSWLLDRVPLRVKTDAIEVKGDYGSLLQLVEMERRAWDAFFVIGPPGSGKTSRAIRSMVEEELRATEGSVLLLAYTNRAADELCGMLDGLQIEGCAVDYIRLGAELSTEPAYQGHLLEKRCRHLQNAEEVREMVAGMRIFVSTTTTIISQMTLLRHKCFALAVIDEASQLLEPQLLPLLFAQMAESGESSIARFVFVGDHKQLPAVVQQSSEASTCEDRDLRAMGLTDCRRSLFERLLTRQQQSGRHELYYLLETQGRMHPELFSFVNEYFYGWRLTCIPLPHQQQTMAERFPHFSKRNSSHLALVLATQRMVFLNCPSTDSSAHEKTNRSEAIACARCIDEIRKLYAAEGRTLRAEHIGIIVPYRGQMAMMRSFLLEYGLHELEDVTIDTVERFQGSERDIIFFLSTVRHPFQLSFLCSSSYLEQSDSREPYVVDRKLNVALTRSREQTVIIGNASLLRRNDLYARLIDSVYYVDDINEYPRSAWDILNT
ncbi:MAG: AAA family ATPase [Bacteroidaceae bacterium]|nr:AAA family ATPase [Bacteroidaceae bacterium]